ncbi:hypothetical protein S40293_04907 [Stachybotrys chartarum IBT 40293]|nr:hypothetical protein S40293_04907 [Stachybotrys chartarum IBT 40293]
MNAADLAWHATPPPATTPEVSSVPVPGVAIGTDHWLESTDRPTPRRGVRRSQRRRRVTPPPSDTALVQISSGSETTAHRPSEDGHSVGPSNHHDESPTITAEPFQSSPFIHLSAPYSIPREDVSNLPSTIDVDWLQTLYREGFEAVFGSWMGRYSCPFLFGRHEAVEKYVSISDMCRHLDQWIATSGTNDTNTVHDTETQAREKDHKIEASLSSTMAAFSARWLPITTDNSTSELEHCALVQTLWRNARRDMLRIMNRPSYRSMLSLYLFALTPIPAGINEEEELDGISGQACVHAALQQIQTLRARQRNLQFSGSKVSPSLTFRETVHTTPESLDTAGFINGESIAYWAALTFDTSASLTLNCRPLLSSGLLGFESEISWRLVRTTSKIFAETAQQWRQEGAEMTDERANQIIAAAAAWKLLGWKLTAIFKEALRDGHEESEIHKAFINVVASIKDFNAIYRSPLEECQRRMPFLGQRTKLRWFSLMLHYHLSILMLVDVIEVTDRHDLLADLGEISNDAETTVVNTLTFGLHNTMMLKRQTGYGSGNELSSDTTFKVPIISIDPYPHHVVASVQLVRKSIDRGFDTGKIAEDTYHDLLSTLEHTLEHLPQSSKSVQAARAKFASSMPGTGSRCGNPFVAMSFHA